MSPLFLLSIALKATLLLALAATVDHVLRGRASAAARHLLWTFAIAALLLLPVLGGILPGWSAPLIPAHGAVEMVAQPEPTAQAINLDYAGAAPEAAPAVARSAETRQPVAAPRLTIAALTTFALGLYVAGVLLLLLKVAGEQWIVRRLRRESVEVRDPQWSALLNSVRAAMGVRRPVALLRGDAPTIPLAWGILRPAVLLPAEADEWCDSRRRAVLLHEVAHIARHDCLTQTLAAVACALYWPHPGAWWAAARLRVERELACDDQALARGIRPHEYAGHLLELARGLQPPRALSTLAVSMATPSNLEARLLAAIDDARVRTAPGRRARVLGALLAALLLLPVAAIRSVAARDVPPPAPRIEAAVTSEMAAPAPVPDAAAGQQQGGVWHLRSATAAESGLEVPAVHVMMNVGGLNTFYVPLNQMDGLSAERIAATADGVRFQLRRDAGTFDFTGAFRGGRGTGRFTFAEDPAFAAALARRGIGQLTSAQLFSMARHDVSLALVEELAKQGYAMPNAAGLVRLGLSGADLRYLREVGALGYRFRTVGELISFSNSGVTPGSIRALAEIGYRDLPASSLVQLQNHSLTADRVRQLNERAGRRLSVPELVALRQSGETTAAAPAPAVVPASFAPAPALAAPVAPAGSTPLAGHWVVTQTRGSFAYLRLNWDDGTNWDRWIPIASLSGVTAGDINSAASPATFRIEQDAGTFELSGAFQDGSGTGPFRFHPNRAFVATLRSLGLEGAGEASDHQLKNLAWGGMSAADIREFRAAGVAPLTFRGVVDMAIFQVTPEYAREVAAQGRRGISTSELIDLWRSRRR